MFPLNQGSNMSSQPSSAGFTQPQNAMQPQSQASYQNNSPSFGSTPSYSAVPNAYAHGGKVKRGKMIMAHFNPKELEVMDHLQGKVEKCPRSGMRSYSHLEEILKNPHILTSVHTHAQNHAHGGSAHTQFSDPHLSEMAGHGVHGDTELALIGPHTHQVFNNLARPGTVTNHMDGRPQYWSLGGTLGGLWNTIKSGASAAAPYIGAAGNAILPAVMPAVQGLATRYGGDIGGQIAQGLGGLAHKGFDALQGMGSQQNQGMARNLGNAAQAALQARQGGASAQEAVGTGIRNVGSSMSGPIGGAVQGFGRAMQQGQGLGGMAQGAAKGAFQGAGGMRGIQGAAQSLIEQYRNGTSPRQMAQNAPQNAMQHAQYSLPTPDSMQNQALSRELPFNPQYA